MKAVNLIPRDRPTGNERDRRAPVALVAVVLLVAVLALGGMLYRSAAAAVDAGRADLALTQAAIDSLPPPQRPVISNSAVSQERADRTAALSGALGNRIPFDRLLRDLSYVMPDDAWLTGLAASAPASGAAAIPGVPAAPSASTGVTIEGATFSHTSVARVLARLSALPLLSDVRLTTSARVEQPAAAAAPQTESKTKAKKQRPVVTFTIGASIRAGSGS